MHFRSRRRLASLASKTLLAIVIAATTPLHSAAAAAAMRVRVRGTAKLTAHASRAQTVAERADERVSELVFSGTLADDADAPLAAQTVTVRVARSADPHDARVAEALRRAQGCDGGPARTAGPSDAPEVAVATDEAGRFCFRARLDPDRYTARIAFEGSGLVDGATKEMTFDLGRRGLTLRFDPAPRVVELDTANAVIDLVATAEGDDGAYAASDLAVALANETAPIGRAVTDASGRARFVVPGAKLGPPGRGELRASFDGDEQTAPASDATPIERRAKVTVRVPAFDRGELEAGVPEDGIDLFAEVASRFGAVSEGSVEALVGEDVVGAAPVERGSARLTITFAAQGTEAFVRLRYVPVSPWYEPAGEPTIRVPIRAPSLASELPMLAAGLAVLAFFLLGRVAGHQNQKKRRAPVPAAERAREGTPRLEVLRGAKGGASGWSGRVVDAHDDVPVRGARVWIERGTFAGRTVLASVETDELGRFSISPIDAIHGDETIAAEARLHARHTQPLPPAGEIAIALAERRRALLTALVAWARRRGPPFDVRPEPTPGHVRRAASDEPETVRWASAVEHAAFGPAEIDARAAQDVERLAPPEPRPDLPVRRS